MNYEYENGITVDLTQSNQNKRDKLSLKKSKPISSLSTTIPKQPALSANTAASISTSMPSSSIQRQFQPKPPQQQQPRHNRTSLFPSSETNKPNYNIIDTYNDTGIDDNIRLDEDDHGFDNNVFVIPFFPL